MVERNHKGGQNPPRVVASPEEEERRRRITSQLNVAFYLIMNAGNKVIYGL
jgi:hypothetical protein